MYPTVGLAQYLLIIMNQSQTNVACLWKRKIDVTTYRYIIPKTMKKFHITQYSPSVAG